MFGTNFFLVITKISLSLSLSLSLFPSLSLCIYVYHVISKLGSSTWNNSLITDIYPAASAQRHAPMFPRTKIIYAYVYLSMTKEKRAIRAQICAGCIIKIIEQVNGTDKAQLIPMLLVSIHIIMKHPLKFQFYVLITPFNLSLIMELLKANEQNQWCIKRCVVWSRNPLCLPCYWL